MSDHYLLHTFQQLSIDYFFEKEKHILHVRTMPLEEGGIAQASEEPGQCIESIVEKFHWQIENVYTFTLPVIDTSR